MKSTLNAGGNSNYSLANIGKRRLCEESKLSVSLMYDQSALHHDQNIRSANES